MSFQVVMAIAGGCLFVGVLIGLLLIALNPQSGSLTHKFATRFALPAVAIALFMFVAILAALHYNAIHLVYERGTLVEEVHTEHDLRKFK